MKEDAFMKREIKSLARRALSLALCAVMALALVPAARAAGVTAGLRSSGSTTLPKLSQQEIAQLLKDNPLTMPDNVFDTEPSISSPYAPGKVTDKALQAAVNRLNALRRIAGLPPVALDAALCENAQYGALLVAVSEFSHYPSKPADMSDAVFQAGQSATSSSNLSAGSTLIQAVDRLMEDDDAGNISRLGHRRWQLNPTMGKVGFGYVRNPSSIYRQFVAEKVFDRSGAGCDYDFIGWPSSGNFPSSQFGKDIPWSVTLNPEKYQTPNQSQLKVTLTHKADGQTWIFSGSNYTAANSGAYFNVDTGGYGVSNCIVFRPNGITSYQGTYTVKIDGLKTRSGQDVTDFQYEVEFFDVNAPASDTAYANTQTVLLDGKPVTFQTYALKDANGGLTNYIKLRDLAYHLNGTNARFSVNWAAGQITLNSGRDYIPNGSELSTPFSGNRPYSPGKNQTVVNGGPRAISSIVLTDDKGGAYTYYQLRDLGRNLGFNVSFINGQVVINTNEPYSDAQ